MKEHVKNALRISRSEPGEPIEAILRIAKQVLPSAVGEEERCECLVGQGDCGLRAHNSEKEMDGSKGILGRKIVQDIMQSKVVWLDASVKLVPVVGYIVLVVKEHMLADAPDVLAENLHIQEDAVPCRKSFLEQEAFTVVESNDLPIKIMTKKQGGQETIAVGAQYRPLLLRGNPWVPFDDCPIVRGRRL